MKLVRAVPVLVSVVLLTGCSLLGLGGTSLQGVEQGLPYETRFDDVKVSEARHLQVSGLDVCTDGGDDVRITGVAMLGSAAPTATGFRISRTSGSENESEGSSQVSPTPPGNASELEPTERFSQPCEAKGRTSLTIDTKIGDLPVDVETVRVTYDAGDDEKTVDLEARIVVCNSSVGCPPEPEDGDEF